MRLIPTFNDSCCSILGSQMYIYIKEKGNQDFTIRPYFVYFDSHVEEFAHILSNILCQSTTNTNNSRQRWAHLAKSNPVRFDWLYVWPACYYKTSIKCPKRYYLWSDSSLSSWKKKVFCPDSSRPYKFIIPT